MSVDAFSLLKPRKKKKLNIFFFFFFLFCKTLPKCFRLAFSGRHPKSAAYMLTNPLIEIFFFLKRNMTPFLMCIFQISHHHSAHPSTMQGNSTEEVACRDGGFQDFGESLWLWLQCSDSPERKTNHFSYKSLCCNVSNAYMQAVESFQVKASLTMWMWVPMFKKTTWLVNVSQKGSKLAIAKIYAWSYLYIILFFLKCVWKSSTAALGDEQPGVSCLRPLDSISCCVLAIHPFPDTWWTSESNQSSREHDHKRESKRENQTRGLQQYEVWAVEVDASWLSWTELTRLRFPTRGRSASALCRLAVSRSTPINRSQLK